VSGQAAVRCPFNSIIATRLDIGCRAPTAAHLPRNGMLLLTDRCVQPVTRQCYKGFSSRLHSSLQNTTALCRVEYRDTSSGDPPTFSLPGRTRERAPGPLHIQSVLLPSARALTYYHGGMLAFPNRGLSFQSLELSMAGIYRHYHIRNIPQMIKSLHFRRSAKATLLLVINLKEWVAA
jgi:hypothetical protein